MITHGRETYQPTSIMRWDRGIFNGSYVKSPFFCSDLVVSTRLSSTGGEEEELNDESVYSLLQRCHGDHGGAVPDGKNPSADGL